MSSSAFHRRARLAPPLAARSTETGSAELAAAVDLMTAVTTETEAAFELSATDPYFRMSLHLIRHHLEGKTVTATSLAAASDLPYATAKRRIGEMLESGLIDQRPRTVTGKTFSLHPSDSLITQWTAYAGRIRRLFEDAFGPGAGRSREEYFYGESYIESRIIEPPSILPEPLRLSGGLRILVHGDPTFMVMDTLKRQFEQIIGCEIRQRAFSIDRLREEALRNAARAASRYDIIAVNLPWIGEFAAKGVLQPLDGVLDVERLDPADFHPAGWRGAHYQGRPYGAPIHTTPEVLFYRKDVFAEQGLEPPRTAEAVLEAAAKLHNPSRGHYGIAWNAARGTALGHTFLMTCAAFGRPVFNLKAITGGFDGEALSGEALRPTIDTPEGLATAEYLLKLLDVAPPGILSMAWYERMRPYAQGKTAMAYGYTQLAPYFELDPTSPAHGQTGYLPHPAGGANGAPIAPVGGYVLGVPANLPEPRARAAAKALAMFASPEAQKLFVQNGSRTTPRYSVGADPQVRRLSEIFDAVEGMAWRDELQFWPRPPVPQISAIIAICGETFHDMLRGVLSPREAVAQAQARAEQIMREPFYKEDPR